MKKLAAILLSAILLFNWIGYRLFISIIEDKADTELQAQLDEDKYDPSQLISIKVPVTYLPYYNNSKSFERVDGKIEIAGVQYNYVKRRIYQDSLEMLCIPNHTSMKLQTAKNEIFKFVNDLQQGKKTDQHPASFKNFSVDYYTADNIFKLNSLSRETAKLASHYSILIPSRYFPTAEQPPDVC